MGEELKETEIFPTHYKEIGDTIRHFSTIRSTLTTFLLSASFGLFALERSTIYITCVGIIFLIMALIVCLIFSYRTERHVKKQKILWDWYWKNPNDTYPSKPDPVNIFGRMLEDKMNWFALIFVGLGITGWIIKSKEFISLNDFITVHLLYILIALVFGVSGYFIGRRKGKTKENKLGKDITIDNDDKLIDLLRVVLKEEERFDEKKVLGRRVKLYLKSYIRDNDKATFKNELEKIIRAKKSPINVDSVKEGLQNVRDAIIKELKK